MIEKLKKQIEDCDKKIEKLQEKKRVLWRKLVELELEDSPLLPVIATPSFRSISFPPVSSPIITPPPRPVRLREYRIELGALIEVPVDEKSFNNHESTYSNYRKNKNWAATVEKSPTAPGGLARSFWERANGSYYYVVPSNLEVGDVLEFATKYKNSWEYWAYHVYLGHTDDQLYTVNCNRDDDFAFNFSKQPIFKYYESFIKQNS